ncbi:hypothetical protein Rcae01_06773 [Novipirellula caenicola]|uniref:Uncharacterized protein n=1 Tax=Novipirellula caenicola TaxID=1536901 RepID=A0ABP9W1K8_9BACT
MQRTFTPPDKSSDWTGSTLMTVPRDFTAKPSRNAPHHRFIPPPQQTHLHCNTIGPHQAGLKKHSPTLPLSHSPTLPLSHSPTLPLSHSPTLPLSHSPTLPLSHSPTLPPSHPPTLPPSHSPTLPLSHSPTLPLSHSPTLPLSHPPTLPLSHSRRFGNRHLPLEQRSQHHLKRSLSSSVRANAKRNPINNTARLAGPPKQPHDTIHPTKHALFGRGETSHTAPARARCEVFARFILTFSEIEPFVLLTAEQEPYILRPSLTE